MAAAIVPPIALGLVIYGLLGPGSRTLALSEVETRLADARDQVSGLELALGRVDSGVRDTAGQLRDLAAVGAAALPAMAADAEAVQAAAERIANCGEAADRATAALRAALPDMARTVSNVGDTLRDVGGESATQLRAVETMLAAVQARNQEAARQADAAIANMAALLARIDEASTRNTTALSKRAFALDAAVDGVLERSANAVGQINEQVDRQMRSFAAGIEETARQLQIFGDDGARLFNQRLEALLKTSGQLTAEFAAHDVGVATLHGAATERFVDLKDRLTALDHAGTSTLDDINTRLAGFQDRAATLQGLLDASQATLAGLDVQSGKLGGTVAEVHAILGERLDETRQSIAGLDGETRQMLDAVALLDSAAQAGAAGVAIAAAAVTAERNAIVDLAGALGSHFDAARSTLADIHEAGAAATLETAAGFAAELARIREVASSTAEAMRGSLATVIDDAMSALQLAASGGSDAAFGDPVRAQLVEIQAATTRAAETGQELSRRLAAQMVKMVEAVAAAEARIDDVETRFALRERSSLAAQSMRLMGQLDTALIDVARLLALPVGEDEWARYLRGDRGAFARAVVPLLDRDMSRRLARLQTHDEAFKTSAATYIQAFESMISGLLGDRDGEALAATLLSSDMGKIYVAIAEAAERLPPSR
ncbi:hypothetical protein [Sandarakinorhabdus sp. DWP1-3-1]|uniref:hypothetical protein n=1 Tax=Sandarakinorhabdus sp. DWP1-3-1 TaxID=2804627 RepID=UPI003CF8D831